MLILIFLPSAPTTTKRPRRPRPKPKKTTPLPEVPQIPLGKYVASHLRNPNSHPSWDPKFYAHN